MRFQVTAESRDGSEAQVTLPYYPGVAAAIAWEYLQRGFSVWIDPAAERRYANGQARDILPTGKVG
jgi:hypothetical protein